MRQIRTNPWAAAMAGVLIGLVQAAVFVGFVDSTVPPHTDADRGFGWELGNILGEAAWFAALVVVSVLLIGVVLAVMRVPLVVLSTLVVLAVEVTIGALLATLVPTDSNWRALTVLLPLAIVLVAVQRLTARWTATRASQPGSGRRSPRR